MTDPIAEALDELVPAFDSPEGDWQAILEAAALPAALAPADRQMPVARRRARRRAPFARRTVRLAAALAVLAFATTLGVAWATGDWTPTSPLALFESNPQGTAAQGFAGGLWDQTVVPDSVKRVATVEIPKVGPVAFWHADTKQGGWCAGLRLSNGAWLGTGDSPLDDGGTVPGCFPTGVIDAGNDGLEWLENDIDAHSVGGVSWRIRSGLITAPGAVKVTDLTTGKSTGVVDGDLFILAIEAPNPSVPPYKSPRLHLVAYDTAGDVVASDCRNCSGG